MSDTATAVATHAEPRVGSNGCEERLDALPWTDRRSYHMGERAIDVRTTSPLFAHWVDSVLPRAAIHDDAPTVYSAVVAGAPPRTRPIHTLYRGCGVLARSDDFTVLKRALLADLETLDDATRTDAIAVDAGLFFVPGRVVLAPSLLLMWLRAFGAGERGGVRVPDGVRTAIDLSTGLAIPPLRRLAAWTAIADDSTQNPFGWPIRVDTIVTFSMAAEHPVHPLSRSATLRHIAAATPNLRTIGGDTLGGLARLVSGAECLGIHPVRSRHHLRTLVAAINAGPSGGPM